MTDASALVQRLSAWPRARPPALSAVFKQSPEAFIVEEIPLVAPSGAGEFALLEIEKRGANTADLAMALAKFCRVPGSAVSFAGRKDRQALTRQWFSVHLPGRPSPDWEALASERWRVLQAHRHHRKLRTGALRGNHFRIRLRSVQLLDDPLEHRLDDLARRGVPNYFGAQRFGLAGGNLQRALKLDPRRRRAPGRSMALSAARSFLFNEVLGERVTAGTWARGVPGDLWMLAGRSAVFGPEDGPEIEARCQRGEIDPTGPLWGSGVPDTQAEALAIESTCAARWPALVELLDAVRMRQERRRLRLIPRELSWVHEGDELELTFSLEAGAFATTVLQELGDIQQVPGATNR